MLQQQHKHSGTPEPGRGAGSWPPIRMFLTASSISGQAAQLASMSYIEPLPQPEGGTQPGLPAAVSMSLLH